MQRYSPDFNWVRGKFMVRDDEGHWCAKDEVDAALSATKAEVERLKDELSTADAVSKQWEDNARFIDGKHNAARAEVWREAISIVEQFANGMPVFADNLLEKLKAKAKEQEGT